LELAAIIGKQLLEKDQQLDAKIEFLENELQKTTEMVNQLRHEINLKDSLLQSFIDSDANSQTENELDTYKAINEKNNSILNDNKKKINNLESENNSLRNKAEFLERESQQWAIKESTLIDSFSKEFEITKSLLNNTQDELKQKTEECLSQQTDIQNILKQMLMLQERVRELTQDNNDMQASHESTTGDLISQINELKQKYNECLRILSNTNEELRVLRRRNNAQKQLLQSSSSVNYFESGDENESLQSKSLAAEVYNTLVNESNS
jgi:chromosome segregation ATPase